MFLRSLDAFDPLCQVDCTQLESWETQLRSTSFAQFVCTVKSMVFYTRILASARPLYHKDVKVAKSRTAHVFGFALLCRYRDVTFR